MSLLDTASLVITPNGTKASKLYSVVPSSGAGDMTVTRATTATRVNSAGLIESVASNVPRLDYSNGTCPSILVEPKRTNVVTYSEDLTNGSWGLETNGTASAPIVTSNYGVSPDGTTNAERVQFSRTGTTASSYSIISKSIPTVSGSATISFYAKTITGTTTLLVYFNSSGQEFTITNQWQRFTFNISSDDASSINFGSRGGSGNFYNGGSTSIDILLWGVQKEAGSYATSYIPTTSASVTRNADVISKTGISSLIGQTEGTIFIDTYIDELTDLNAWFLKENATFDTFVFLQRETSGIIAVGYYGSGALQARIETGTSQPIGRYKIAFGYKNNDFVLYINGTQIGTDTSGSVTGLMDYIDLHWTQTGKNKQNTVALWKTRLTNTQLAQLTTI